MKDRGRIFGYERHSEVLNLMVIPLHLPAHLVRQIEEEGATAYPNECCGILFGRELAGAADASTPGLPLRIIERLQTAANTFDEEERHHRFSISPHQLMRAEREAADSGQLVMGFYHSHPDHPARPSNYDREHAWPFYSYVIVSVVGGQPLDMTSWVLDDDAHIFQRQEIVSGNGP
jgi:proteasome lid subunit RPN8/RPN11